MPHLFTEPQWRAIAEVERRSEPSYWEPIFLEKRLIGPAFVGGEFVLAYCPPPPHSIYRLCGPSLPRYMVYERHSRLRFTWVIHSKQDVLVGARQRLELIPPDYLAQMIQRENARVLEEDAKRQAGAAIAKAREEKKNKRKVSKRAAAVFGASAGKCHYCEAALVLDGKWHIEHKMPRALFGGSEQANLVASCVPCNRKKRDRTDLEFIAATSPQIVGGSDAL